MNDKDNAVYQALGRVNRFGATHATAFPAASNAVAGFARGIQIAGGIGPDNSVPGIPASPATGARNHLFAEVWEDLKAISGTARGISREDPGFAADFASAATPTAKSSPPPPTSSATCKIPPPSPNSSPTTCPRVSSPTSRPISPPSMAGVRNKPTTKWQTSATPSAPAD